MNDRDGAADGLLSVYRASGPDYAAFLQGQLTQDINRINADNPLGLAASCDPKGRVLAVVTLVSQPDGVLLFLRRDIAAGWVQRLLMYRLRSKVDIGEAEGARALAIDAAHLPAGPVSAPLVPAADGEVRQSANRAITVRRVGDIAEIYAADGAALAPLAGAALDAEAWLAARVRAGLPDPGPAAAGRHTPQMLNLEQLGAVSFSKGCYTGQEIVARTQHLGKVKRRLFHVATSNGDAIAEGDDVVDADGRAVGAVVTSAGPEALAVLRQERAAEPGLATSAGAALRVTSLLESA